MKTLTLLLLLSFSAYAEDKVPLDQQRTEHGVPLNDFCSSNALKRIKELDELGSKDVELIKKSQAEINGLMAQKNLLSGFLSLRDDFLSSIKKIQDEKVAADAKTVETFKKLMRSALAIQAVTAVYETTPAMPSNKNEDELKTLCNVETNKELALCKYFNKFFSLTNNETRRVLNASVIQLKAANENMTPEQKIKMHESFNTIMTTLPEDLTPSVVLSTLANRAENFSNFMGNDTYASLTSCLSGKDDLCKKLLKDQQSRAGIQESLGQEFSSVKIAFAETKKAFIKTKMESLATSLNENEAKRNKDLAALFDDKLKSALKLFNDETNRGKLTEIGVNAEDISAFKTQCLDPAQKEKCQETGKKLVSLFEGKVKELDAKIRELSDNLESVSSTGGKLGQLMKMRQYVAQKYLRKCRNATIAEVRNPMGACALLASGREPASDDSVDSLSKKMRGVISKLINNNPLSNNRGELGPFSKDELSVYSSYCSDTSARSNFADICEDIRRETVAIKNQKETKEWEDFNKKYYVVQNDKSKNGYDVYEKKSNAVIFAEGLSQGIARIYPTWMSSMNLQYQISALESQGMFMQQLNYMYSPTSPWYQYTVMPYFQGNYYTFPTTTNFNNPFTNTTGFNFTP